MSPSTTDPKQSPREAWREAFLAPLRSTQLRAHFDTLGWDATLAAMFTRSHALLSEHAPGWGVTYSDIKSKFASLRVYSGLSNPQDTLAERLRRNPDDPEIAKLSPYDGRRQEWAREQAEARIPEPAGVEELSASAQEALHTVSNLGDAAESLSALCCETCAAPGRAAGSGWVSCSCPECEASSSRDARWEQGQSAITRRVFPGWMLDMALADQQFGAAERQRGWLSDPRTTEERRLEALTLLSGELSPKALSEMTRRLFHGVDLNADLGDGSRALHYGFSDALCLELLALGANPFIPDATGRDAFAWSLALEGDGRPALLARAQAMSLGQELSTGASRSGPKAL